VGREEMKGSRIARSLTAAALALGLSAAPAHAEPANTVEGCIEQIGDLIELTREADYRNSRDEAGLVGKLGNAIQKLAQGKYGDAAQKLIPDYQSKVNTLAASGKMTGGGLLAPTADEVVSCINSLG
jgi:hypothetical protein